MPSRSDITYFGAGPAALPTEVLQTASQALVDFQGTHTHTQLKDRDSPTKRDEMQSLLTFIKALAWASPSIPTDLP